MALVAGSFCIHIFVALMYRNIARTEHVLLYGLNIIYG